MAAMSAADEENERREAIKRGRYLARRHGIRDNVALALAYRELGYSHSGIAQKVDVGQSTVKQWMVQIATRCGLQATETKWEGQREGPLEEPTTEELRDDLHPAVLGDYLEIAQKYPEDVPESVDLIVLEETIVSYLTYARENPEDVPTGVNLGDLEDLLGGRREWKVPCDVAFDEIETEWGHAHGVRVTCSRCGLIETAGGQHDGSVTRCLVQLRENCPLGENNYYEAN